MLHITITKDGDTLFDLDTKGILGAVNDPEADGTHCIVCMDGITGADAGALLAGVNDAKAGLLRDHPELQIIELMDKLKRRFGIKDEDNGASAEDWTDLTPDAET